MAPVAEEKKAPRKCQFQYEGETFVIPKGMDLDEAIEALKLQSEEENVTVTISEKIKAFPLDGAVALMRVLKRRYGWTHLTPTPSMWGPKPPLMIGVEVGVNETLQVPWGNMQIPNIDGTITTSYDFDNEMPVFVLSGKVKRKHEARLAEIANEIREEVRSNSIYRSKSVKINFRDSEGDRKTFDPSLCPRFLDLKSMGDTTPIFSEAIENAIRVNIHNPIMYSDRCRQKGASLKKGVMLGGPYGTGKTLEAFRTAKLCMEHGWTFLYLENVQDLDMAINFAKLYEPCVLFAEDCDKAATGPRTTEMDRLLNTIDGVESKGDKAVMVVLTTNHLEIINPAFLRPGRIDAVINVLPPDEKACYRIVQKYIGEGDCKMDGSEEEFIRSFKCLVGANAAFFRNVVEQAKLSAIGKMQSDDDVVTIRPSDLEAVAKGMIPHCKLINPNHGEKSLLDLEEQTIDPLQMAMDIFMQKGAEAILNQITNPRMLEKIIVKQMKKGGGGRGSLN